MKSDLPPIDGDEIARGARPSLDRIVAETSADLAEWRALFNRIKQLEREQAALLGRL